MASPWIQKRRPEHPAAGECPECGKASDARSKKGRCTDCMREATRAWKQMVAEKAQENAARADAFSAIYAAAVAAGEKAMADCRPASMAVAEHENPLDDTSAVKRAWIVPDGVCGFAWITIRPGNCGFANWCKKHDIARPAYGGGVQIWVSPGGQSYEKKTAFAAAAARVIAARLRAMGEKGAVYADGRLD